MVTAQGEHGRTMTLVPGRALLLTSWLLLPFQSSLMCSCLELCLLLAVGDLSVYTSCLLIQSSATLRLERSKLRAGRPVMRSAPTAQAGALEWRLITEHRKFGTAPSPYQLCYSPILHWHALHLSASPSTASASASRRSSSPRGSNREQWEPTSQYEHSSIPATVKRSSTSRSSSPSATRGPARSSPCSRAPRQEPTAQVRDKQ
ncbi:uncharacterized protein LOC133886463 [Phragmites australis]|uniref:uncharacterized protein LOC133886463 n=1 Tax=Phragmites australis TaxID=29695 RepID=UPI002D794913|nr:uncharacterized protein LOC133886463 [Phragmites australis]